MLAIWAVAIPLVGLLGTMAYGLVRMGRWIGSIETELRALRGEVKNVTRFLGMKRRTAGGRPG